jgi:hypothetical protein
MTGANSGRLTLTPGLGILIAISAIGIVAIAYRFMATRGDS